MMASLKEKWSSSTHYAKFLWNCGRLTKPHKTEEKSDQLLPPCSELRNILVHGMSKDFLPVHHFNYIWIVMTDHWWSSSSPSCHVWWGICPIWRRGVWQRGAGCFCQYSNNQMMSLMIVINIVIISCFCQYSNNNRRVGGNKHLVGGSYGANC